MESKTNTVSAIISLRYAGAKKRSPAIDSLPDEVSEAYPASGLYFFSGRLKEHHVLPAACRSAMVSTLQRPISLT